MRRTLACVGLLAVVAAVFSHEWRFFITPDPTVLLDIRDDIRVIEDPRQWPAEHGQLENQGFVPCTSGMWAESGWCLPAEHEGALRLILPSQPQSRGLLLRLFFFHRTPNAHHRLLVYREGESTPRLTFEDIHFADARLDLSPVLAGPGGRVILSFEGTNPSSQPDVFVQYFEVRFFTDPVPAAPALPRMILAFFALGLCLLPLVSWRTLLPLWTVLTIGFALRYYALTQALWLPLDWDALGFAQLAKQMRLFSENGFYSARFGLREPLFVLLVKAMLWLLGDSETHVRLVSFIGSLVAILMVYRLGQKLFGTRLGLLGAFLVAVSLPLVRESVRGLRLEWEIVLLLLLLELAFLDTVRSRWVRVGLMGVLGGLLSLLRTPYMFGLTVVLAVACFPRHRGGLTGMILVLVMMWGLYGPHLWNSYRLSGRVFDIRADWWANLEFAGQPGWRSKPEVWRNVQGDSVPMSPFEYLFKLHSVPEVIIGSLRGLGKLSRHMEVVAFAGVSRRVTGLNLTWLDGVFQLAGLIGLALAATRSKWRWMPLVFLILLAHVAFVYDHGGTEPWRHTYHVFPLVVFGALLSVSIVTQKLKHLMGSEKRHA